MLYITFKKPDWGDQNWILHTKSYFANWLDPNVLNDPFVKEIVKGVDNSELVGPNLVISPVLGAIPPSSLSGGTKTLIILYAQDKPVTGLSLSDNTIPWLLKIAEMKDITIFLGHRVHFPDKMDAIILDNGISVNSDSDFVKQWLLTQGYTEEDFDD